MSVRARPGAPTLQPQAARPSSVVGIAQYGPGMQCRINEVSIHYVEHGTGVPLIALHGAGVDHREIEAAIEAIIPDDGYRRIYPDLPGMGRTTGTDALTGNDDVVALLADFIDHLLDQPFLLLGHSYGAYLARASQHGDRIGYSVWRCCVRSAKARATCRQRPWYEQMRMPTANLNPTSGRDSMTTSSCAHVRMRAAIASTWSRERRASTRPRWGASSPDGRLRSGRTPSGDRA